MKDFVKILTALNTVGLAFLLLKAFREEQEAGNSFEFFLEDTLSDVAYGQNELFSQN